MTRKPGSRFCSWLGFVGFMHREEEESNQAESVLFLLTRTAPAPRHAAEMPAAAAPSAAPRGEHVHGVTALRERFPRAT